MAVGLVCAGFASMALRRRGGPRCLRLAVAAAVGLAFAAEGLLTERSRPWLR